MRRVCIQTGHFKIEEITSENLRSWRSPTVLKRSTGASGERDYFWSKVMPLLRDKLIEAGVAVHIATSIYEEEIYRREYDLWISLHYDGGGVGERCMISAPNRDTQPAYLHETAQIEAERFCQIWKSVYPEIVGVPNRDDIITAGMKDYYAFDYVGYDTPSVIIEHFNHSSPRGTYLKEHPELVAEADFKAIVNFLGIPEEPLVTTNRYQIVYKGEVLQEYEFNPTDRITELANEAEEKDAQIADLISEIGTTKANMADVEGALATAQADYTRATIERDDAKTALSVAERKVTTLEAEKLILMDKLEKIKSTDPLAAYDGIELIKEGLQKIFSRKKKS